MEIRNSERSQHSKLRLCPPRALASGGPWTACEVELVDRHASTDAVTTTDEPLLNKVYELGTRWDWTVLSRSQPWYIEDRVLKMLRSNKMRAVQSADELQDLHGYSISVQAPRKGSGEQPCGDTCVRRRLDGITYSSMTISLLLRSQDAAVGFCKLSVNMSLREADAIPDIRIEVGAVQIEPEWRGKGLSRLLAEAATNATIRALSKFQIMLRAYGAKDELDVVLLLERNAISDAGERFLHALGKQIRMKTCENATAAPDGRSTFRIARIGAPNDHLDRCDECW